MKLLICTQLVDRRDPILGFFHHWIEEFAAHCEKVIVICLAKGEYALPSNVEVISLGKESGVPRLQRALRFMRIVLARRKDYDAVFVHMNHEYIMLAGALWRLLGKPVGLWYVHKAVTLRLRIGTFFSTVVFSVSPESFRLKTAKLATVGHGIDSTLYRSTHEPHGDTLRVITLGRISATKRIKEMLTALDVLERRGVPFEFTIIGAPVYDADRTYEQELLAEIRSRPYHARVHFLGAVALPVVVEELARADVFLNASKTGSIDKAVLEAMSAGVVPVAGNEAFRVLLEPYGTYTPIEDPERFATAIEKAWTIDSTPLRAYVRDSHSLERLIPEVLKALA